MRCLNKKLVTIRNNVHNKQGYVHYTEQEVSEVFKVVSKDAIIVHHV